MRTIGPLKLVVRSVGILIGRTKRIVFCLPSILTLMGLGVTVLSDRGGTERLNPVTHPTLVIKRALREAEVGRRISPCTLSVMRWVALLCIVFGIIFTVLGLITVVIDLLVGGVVLASAGFCITTLELLLTPEDPSHDVRLIQWIREWRDR